MDVKDTIKRYKTSQECAEALRGMMQAKEKWLEYVNRRESELAIS